MRPLRGLRGGRRDGGARRLGQSVGRPLPAAPGHQGQNEHDAKPFLHKSTPFAAASSSFHQEPFVAEMRAMGFVVS